MSPIRPSQRARYPEDWPAISQSIRGRDGRSGGRCECTGQCGTDHQAELFANDPTADALDDDELHQFYGPDLSRCLADNGRPHPVTSSVVVLTVAHLDHQPEHCDPANLLAMCQRCHLRYDAPHHAETRAANRAAALAGQMAPLFENPLPEGK